MSARARLAASARQRRIGGATSARARARDAPACSQYRLRNITICFVHSAASAVVVAWFAATRWRVLLNNPAFYCEAWMLHLPLMSIGARSRASTEAVDSGDL